MTRIHELRIALTVDDYDRAVEFYRDALGRATVLIGGTAARQARGGGPIGLR